jgi:L-Ala-D/L-Glu epimerase
VKIRRLTWHAYRIPFRRTFVTSTGAQQVREGVIARLESNSGIYGLGEIAPLRAAPRIVAHLLEVLQPRLAGIDLDDIVHAVSRLDAANDIATGVRCGLDVAACDLLGKDAEVPIAELLGGRRRPVVPVNATISASIPEQAAQAALRAVESGFRCVKLKVGMMGSISAECDLVRAVRDAAGSSALIRLDANQAWTTKTAIETIRALEPFGIEFVEQPVDAMDLESLAAVRRAVKVPIAADEAVTSLDAARAIIEAGAADLLVIKPMVVGGLRPAREIIKHAAGAGIEAVVTTTIDSGVGIAAALHLAASFPGTRACGLATAELLECDLTSPTPQPHDGQMPCPNTPGLGVEMDELKAAPYLERT